MLLCELIVAVSFKSFRHHAGKQQWSSFFYSACTVALQTGRWLQSSPPVAAVHEESKDKSTIGFSPFCPACDLQLCLP